MRHCPPSAAPSASLGRAHLPLAGRGEAGLVHFVGMASVAVGHHAAPGDAAPRLRRQVGQVGRRPALELAHVGVEVYDLEVAETLPGAKVAACV